MTTEKLTARLSDGTEWEVLSTAGPTCGMRSGVPYRDETIRVELKPKKPSPPKEVWVSCDKDGDVWNVEKHNFSNGGGYPCHRYILAPEETKTERMVKASGLTDPSPFNVLKPKPAREWWDVRYLDDGRPYCSYDNEAQAKLWCEQENGWLRQANHKPRYEVVHVWEVV